MKEVCLKHGFEGIFPPDDAPDLEPLREEELDGPYTRLAYIFDRDNLHIRNSNMIIANLSPFHGHEPDSGTAFEAGICYGLGYPCYAFIKDGRPLCERISCKKTEEGNWIDIQGSFVEDYGLPINKKIADRVRIVIGDLEDAARLAADELGCIPG